MTGREHWPCGCETWREGVEFKLLWCEDETCPVYLAVIKESLVRGNEIQLRLLGKRT